MLNTQNQGMKLLVKCESCNETFQIGADENAQKIIHKKKFDVNGQSIFITYYDCPECGRRHFVQIDDSVSLEKLKDISRQFVKLSLIKKNGKKIYFKQLVRFKKARQDLTIYRINLMKKYNGIELKDDDSGNSFVLRFSI